MNGRSVKRRILSNSTERQIREKHLRHIKKLQRQRIIFRSVLILICVALVLSAVIFLTPIFNIKNLNIEGNSRVSTETINEQLPYVMGENLFKVSKGMIRDNLSEITYISNVEVDKKLFPPTISVVITEKLPVAAVLTENGYSVIDMECTILEESPELPQDVAELNFYHESFNDFLNDNEATGELYRFLSISNKIGIINEITKIEIIENNEINFEYDGRLNVICGSGIDMEKKLPLLKETVNNPALGSNAHGEIDLSATGTAVHRP